MLELSATFAQFAAYVGMLGVVGAVVAELTLRAPRAGVARLRALAIAGAIVTTIAAACGMAVLMLRIGGGLDVDTLQLVWSTNVGTAAALRAGGAIAVLALTPLANREFGRIARLVAVILIASSFNYVGHGAAHSEAGGFAAALHATLAAWWVSSLFALRAVFAHESMSTYAQLVARFSRLAVVAIMLLLIAGIALVVWLAPRPFAFTPYVLWLSVKISLALGVLGIASYNKLRLTPRVMANDRDAAKSLDRAIVAELGLIAGVLLATAVMTTYHSPDE